MSAQMKRFGTKMTCSECKHTFPVNLDLTKNKQDLVCPNCGAKILLNSGRDSIEKQLDTAIKKAIKKAGLK